MKNFLYKVTLFSIPVFAFLILAGFFAGGYTDPFYVRFTTPKQQNLILGSSRSAQGLRPEIINKILEKKFFNYSFTIAHSPYGPVYLESIKKKHNKRKGGIFILEVNPWTISSRIQDPEDYTRFRENNLCLANMYFVNINPNYEYLFKNMQGNYNRIFVPPYKNHFLHEDGWLEVNVPMDSLSIEKRIEKKLKDYKENILPVSKISQYRIKYLNKAILYFKQYGKVYLVRVPVSSGILELENQLAPEFDQDIGQAISNADGYLDLTRTNDQFIYTDGNHLYKDSGKKVSTIIANWIKKEKN